jgi:small conductance mechanosensitive channel
MEDVLAKVYKILALWGLKVVGALLILVIGWWLSKLISNLVAKALRRGKTEETLVKFLRSLCYIALMTFVIITALRKLGFDTMSAVAVVGAAGLAIGFALQGSLSNFAAGVMMIIFKPFKVGDFIDAAGVKGSVHEIGIFTTVLNSPENVRIIIPNGQITGGNIHNFAVNGTRRVDLVVGVSYDDDLKKAKQVIEKVLADDERILKDPAWTVAVSELADSSVNFVVRPWVKSSDYWNVYFDTTHKIKESLDQSGITIPYPQRDVHIKEGKAAVA